MSRPPTTDLEALILRAQGGDEAAWASLVERQAPGLRRRIRARLGPVVRRRIAESDVMQETWIIATRQLQDFEFQGAGSFQAWLGAIADNAARGLLRRHAGAEKRDVRTEVAPGSRPGTQHHSAPGPTASAEAIGRELRQQVEAAMRTLAEDHRTVIELLQHRRVTIAEAAELMGRTPNAIKKLHGRALAELARHLDVRGRSPRGSD